MKACVNIDKLPTYVISGYKNDATNPVAGLRHMVYNSEFTRIGIQDNVTEVASKYITPSDYGMKEGCGQYGLTLSHEEVWKSIISNNLKHAMVVEDDVLFHDKFRDLLSVYFQQVEDDFLYCNLGGPPIWPPTAKGLDLIDDIVIQNDYAYCTHNYIISYEGAMNLLMYHEQLKRLSIFKELGAGETKIDLMLWNCYKRSSHTDQMKWYTFKSTAMHPAQFNGFSWTQPRLGDEGTGKWPEEFSTQDIPREYLAVKLFGWGLSYQYQAHFKEVSANINSLMRK
tara:strand:- start:1506 stop:2354 length:849 start_codon:yes stop_codon:yes gene_type:complete